MQERTSKTFLNYILEKTISETTNSHVVQASKDGKELILKFPREDSPRIRAKYLKEFETAKQFDSPYILKYLNVEKYFNGVLLVLENFGGISLSDYIKSTKVSNFEDHRKYQTFHCPGI